MTRNLRAFPLIAAALVAGLAAVLCQAGGPSADNAAPAPPAMTAPAELAYVGVGSCASASCHGGDAKRSVKRSEYTVWVSNDRHSRAQSVLAEPRSHAIARNLGGALADSPETNRLCLNCHATPGPTSVLDPCAPREGISCESCHGPASHWLAEHTTDSWRGLSLDQKARWGMRPTKDLLVRGTMCVECHVGSHGRDVNHDLIAAGHPSLRFELSAFLAQLPKHWNESDDRARNPDLQARQWAIGQVASAQAELRLLEQRAGSAGTSRVERAPWPELAEYDCFSCHHDLAPQSGRTETPYALQRRGRPAWATWYVPLPTMLTGLTAPAETPRASLSELMSQPLPPPADVARAAGAAARGLDDLLRRVAHEPIDAATIQAHLAALWSESQTPPPTSWDRAAQLYLARAALYHAQGDLDPSARDPQLRAELLAMAARLAFPADFNSPRGAGPA
ncbi:MAG TPA: multiheme c-type cytochrome, partial [Isosphaeraceae bacterium]|nr:multiheme c-type cytochrome [Isosphaeraceae bacterium]